MMSKYCTRSRAMTMWLTVFLSLLYIINEWQLLLSLAGNERNGKPDYHKDQPFSFSSNSMTRDVSIARQTTIKDKINMTVYLQSKNEQDGLTKDKHTDIEIHEVIHRAFFGLGHRLHRSAAAWHLIKTIRDATSVDATFVAPNIKPQYQFRFHWESCQSSVGYGGVTNRENATSIKNNDDIDDYNVFHYLFGSDVWPLSYTLKEDSVTPRISERILHHEEQMYVTTQPKRKMIVIRNDVYGYIKGQLYKDLHLPIPTSSSASAASNEFKRMPSSTKTSYLDNQHFYPTYFDGKLQSDVDFYQRLTSKYKFQDRIQEFMEQYKFSSRLVIGIHLRVGNGEGMHFEETGRGIVINETEFIVNLVKTIQVFLDQQSSRDQNQLRPFIFLATDTAYLIPVVQNATQKLLEIETVVLSQIRLEKHQGVTFSALEGAGVNCLHGWQAMVSDMMLLSNVNVLIAARHSTFTQSLPMTMLFHRKQQFCEVSDTGRIMTCTSDIHNWLFRNRPDQILTYSVDKNAEPVAHRLTVLLPDVIEPYEFHQAQEFLRSPWNVLTDHEAIFRFGSTKIFKKYRNQKPQNNKSEWNYQ